MKKKYKLQMQFVNIIRLPDGKEASVIVAELEALSFNHATMLSIGIIAQYAPNPIRATALEEMEQTRIVPATMIPPTRG